MKNRFGKWLGAVVLFHLLIASIAVCQDKSPKEKPWIMGKIKGNTRGQVITIILVNLSTNQRMETSLNKYGWYAFSDMGQGRPADHKLIIYAGETEVKQVGLSGVRAGGKVPEINL